MFKTLNAFRNGLKEGSNKQGTHKRDIKKDKEIRDNLSEKQLDKSIADSFPASDPASTY